MWYGLAIETATSISFPSAASARIISAPAFIATKLTAYRDRGRGDVFASHDLEDVLTIVDTRPSLLDEVDRSVAPLRAFVADEVRALLETPAFADALHGHVEQGPMTAGRTAIVLSRLKRLTASG